MLYGGFCQLRFQSLVYFESKNKDDEELVLQPTMFSVLEGLCFHHSHQNFQPFYDNHQMGFHEIKRKVEGLIQSHINFHSFKDPFATCLELVSRPNFSNLIKVEFGF
jgi:hypothetical protein